MKKKYYTWEECLNLREVKVRTNNIQLPSNISAITIMSAIGCNFDWLHCFSLRWNGRVIYFLFWRKINGRQYFWRVVCFCVSPYEGSKSFYTY